MKTNTPISPIIYIEYQDGFFVVRSNNQNLKVEYHVYPDRIHQITRGQNDFDIETFKRLEGLAVRAAHVAENYNQYLQHALDNEN